jgi:O-antigen ligase
MPNTRSLSVSSSKLWNAPMAALFLWICLWFNLNTGFWNIGFAESFYDWQLSIRGALPFLILPVAGFALIRRKRLNLPRNSPSRLLFLYGAFTTFAAIFSPKPMWSLYWSMAFLATILTAWTFVGRLDPVQAARQLLKVTWVAAFIVAAIIGYQARNSVFSEIGTGYAVVSSDLNGLSRSSGVARWAAVPGLVCLVRAYHTRRFSHVAFFIGSAAVSFFIVYRMQSRGAVFGSLAALLFAVLISSRIRRYAFPFAALAIVVILLLDSPATVSDRVAVYLARGQSREQFLSMTGRTRAYRHAVTAFEEAPVFGRGQWADRLIIGEHAHNSFLQALLNGGILGGIPYFASWVTGWMLFYKLQKDSARLHPNDRVHLLECGAVMMFFTVRAIPETTTASFAVDLLVMTAVYVYLEILTVLMEKRGARQLFQSCYLVPLRVAKPLGPERIEIYRQI